MIRCKRTLSATDVNYKIICAGSNFDIGQEQDVTVCCAGKEYSAKTHSKTKGRIDGLSKLYKDFNFAVGDTLELAYDADLKVVFMVKLKDINAETQSDTLPSANSAQQKSEETKRESIFAAWKAEDEALERKERLRDIFSGLELVAKHWEYYQEDYASLYAPYGGFERKTSAASNNGWIAYKFYNKDGCYLRNEDTDEVFSFTLQEEFRVATLIGLNPAGIWFMGYGKDRESMGYIYCFCPYTDETKKIRFNAKKSLQISCPCIYDRDIYYISQISETMMTVLHVTENGGEMELLSRFWGRNDKLGNLSVSSDSLVFHIRTAKADQESGWLFYHLFEGTTTFIPETVVSVKMMDISKGIMWTSITDREAAALGIYDAVQARKIWIARRIEPVKEGAYLVYKKSGKPVIWNTGGHPIGYFDGEVMYTCHYYWELLRIEKNGETSRLGGLGKHGECNKITVSKKYLYLNFDARFPVRLPKRFSEFEGIAEDNPEAVLHGKLWDTF